MMAFGNCRITFGNPLGKLADRHFGVADIMEDQRLNIVDVADTADIQFKLNNI